MSNDNPGYLVILEAKQGRETALAEFLASGLAMAARDTGIRSWYAFRITSTRFGIYDTFVDSDAQQAHLSSPLAQALQDVADDLLAQPPDVQPLEVVATKTGGARL